MCIGGECVEVTDITVFTPTYNRACTLPILFESLKKQDGLKKYEMEWIIVDDGSSDDTEEIVSGWIDDSPFPVRYYKKENEGKHIAINYGVKKASGKWFFIVDSDDYLSPDAITTVMYYALQIDEDNSFAGVVGLRGNFKGETLSAWYGKDKKTNADTNQDEYIDATALEYRYKYNIAGDRAEVIRTDLLKRYPFPQFENEKFLSESVMWYAVANDGYRFRWFNRVIYYTEYRADGLTINIEEHYKKAWRGTCYFANQMLSYKGVPVKEKIKRCSSYYRYGLYGKVSLTKLIKECKSKTLTPLGIFIACLKRIKSV